MIRATPTLMLGIVVLLSACDKNTGVVIADNDAPASGAETMLPRPETPSGSVTGMPAGPGPNRIDPAATQSTDATSPTVPGSADTDDLPDAADPSVMGEASPDGATPLPAEPTVQDAVSLLRDYYAAISAHDYAHAWAIWADGGRASGQTPQQFADGFANTINVEVRLVAPGQVEGAAGSRYLEVPVAVEALQRDGTVQQFAGTYTLRRAVVDGASAQERAWRIASARLRQVRS